MKSYTVSIKETLLRHISIEAETEAEAIQLVTEMLKTNYTRAPGSASNQLLQILKGYTLMS